MIASELADARRSLAAYALPPARAPLHWPLNTALLFTTLRNAAIGAGLQAPESAIAVLEELNRLCMDLATVARQTDSASDAARYEAAKTTLVRGINHTIHLVA